MPFSRHQWAHVEPTINKLRDILRLRIGLFRAVYQYFSSLLGALASNEVARAQGIANLDAEVLGSWMKALRASLVAHDVVFATIPVGRLEGAGGVLEALRAEGFSVKAPE